MKCSLLLSVLSPGSSSRFEDKHPPSSLHTHLPSGPWTRVGRKWPRVETGDRLSRIGGGNAHALIGGELIRSWTIISRGGNRQLQRQGQAHSWWTASTEGHRKRISSQRRAEREGEEKETRVNFAEG